MEESRFALSKRLPARNAGVGYNPNCSIHVDIPARLAVGSIIKMKLYATVNK
jgi:hypothetical protein